jgi:hypothetical protein
MYSYTVSKEEAIKSYPMRTQYIRKAMHKYSTFINLFSIIFLIPIQEDSLNIGSIIVGEE